MKVAEIMSRNLVTVEPDDRLSLVKEIFDHAQFRHLLVLEQGVLFGVVSDRDLLKAVSPYVGSQVETWRDTATLNKCVHQIMSRKPVVLSAEADVLEAVRLFNQHRISCLPVVYQDMRPLGILTWRDLLRHWPGLKEADEAALAAAAAAKAEAAKMAEMEAKLAELRAAARAKAAAQRTAAVKP